MTPRELADDVAAVVEAIRAETEYLALSPHRNPSGWERESGRAYRRVAVNLRQLVERRGAYGHDPALLDGWDGKRAKRAADQAVKQGLLCGYVEEHSKRWKFVYAVPEMVDKVRAELDLTDEQRALRSLDGARARVDHERESDGRWRSSDDVPTWMRFDAPYEADTLAAMGEIVEVPKHYPSAKRQFVLAEHHAQFVEAQERHDRNVAALDARQDAAQAFLNEAAGPSTDRGQIIRHIKLDLTQAERLVELLQAAQVEAASRG